MNNATGEVSSERLRSFIERVEQLEEQKHAVTDDIKSVYQEIKSSGFESKIVRKIVKLRSMSPEKRREEDDLMDLYRASLGLD